MRPHVAVFDNFFAQRQADELHAYLTSAKYEDYVSPTDGVTYPGILRDIPAEYSRVLATKLYLMLGEQIRPNVIFARLTSAAQTEAPNKVHSDRIMGAGACLIYMTRVLPLQGSGTAFYRHFKYGDKHTDEVIPAEIQTNVLADGIWQRRMFVRGEFNRALIYDSRLWHCAEPVGGFGRGPEDGRIVLTCFFDYE